MAYFLIELYKAFIESGRQVKEAKYIQTMNEIMHYINQYKGNSQELWSHLRKSEDESYLY
jgi:hypothetical protein